MKTKSVILTKDERDVLILVAPHIGEKHLSNSEIARRLGIPVSKVKTLIHQACVKLKARNRIEAIHLAIRRGGMSIDDFYSLDELAEMFSSLDPDILSKIEQHLMRRETEQVYTCEENEQSIHMDRTQDTVLTERERDILILVASGSANKEIADRLCISIGSVGIFLNRACRKLGANGKMHAVSLALKHREITLDNIHSTYDLAQYLIRSRDDNIEKMEQLRMIIAAKPATFSGKSVTASEVGCLRRSPCP